MDVSVDSLILRSLSVSDMPNSSFVTMTDKVDAINEGFRYVYNILLDNDDDFYVTAVNPVVTSLYTLPDDFMRVRAVDVNDNGLYSEVKKFALNQRNMLQNTSVTSPWYRLQGNNLYIIPQGQAFTLRIWYYPAPLTIVPASLQTWATATSYRQGDMIVEATNYYSCMVSHTSGTFATDLVAGKWNLYADDTAETSITYPNNLVREIISYGAAIKFKTKAREGDDKVVKVKYEYDNFVQQFRTQVRRDDGNYERIQDSYQQGGVMWP